MPASGRGRHRLDLRNRKLEGLWIQNIEIKQKESKKKKRNSKETVFPGADAGGQAVLMEKGKKGINPIFLPIDRSEIKHSTHFFFFLPRLKCVLVRKNP